MNAQTFAPSLNAITKALPRIQQLLAGHVNELSAFGLMLRASHVLYDGKTPATSAQETRLRVAAKRSAQRAANNKRRGSAKTSGAVPGSITPPPTPVAARRKASPPVVVKPIPAPRKLLAGVSQAANQEAVEEKFITVTAKRRQQRSKSANDVVISFAAQGSYPSPLSQSAPVIDCIANMRLKKMLNREAQGFRQPTIKDARALVNLGKKAVSRLPALISVVVGQKSAILDPLVPYHWPWLAACVPSLDLGDLSRMVKEASLVFTVNRGLILKDQAQKAAAEKKAKQQREATFAKLRARTEQLTSTSPSQLEGSPPTPPLVSEAMSPGLVVSTEEEWKSDPTRIPYWVTLPPKQQKKKNAKKSRSSGRGSLEVM